MIVLDTHVLIWHYSEPTKLSKAAKAALTTATRVAVSAITCWEVTMLAERGRIALDRNVDLWLRQVGAELDVVAVDCAIARAAGELAGAAVPGDPADRLIWATARSLGASLVTADRGLRAFAPAETIW